MEKRNSRKLVSPRSFYGPAAPLQEVPIGSGGYPAGASSQSGSGGYPTPTGGDDSMAGVDVKAKNNKFNKIHDPDRPVNVEPVGRMKDPQVRLIPGSQ